MSEQGDLLAADKLWRDLAWEGAKKRWQWGAGYLMATADELLQKQTVSPLNQKPWNEVAQRFLDAVRSSEIGLVGDKGQLRHIGSDDVAVTSFAMQYKPNPETPDKDLVVCVINRRAEELTRVVGGHDTTDSVNAIADAVYTLENTPQDRRVSAKDVPDEYFNQNGMVGLEIEV